MNNLKGKKLLFFSDLHYKTTKLNVDALESIFLKINPDWIVFGGDLISFAVYQSQAFNVLKQLTQSLPNAAKVAVYGNWDLRRSRWYAYAKWRKAYEDVGFHLLVNEGLKIKGINFYGFDDSRTSSSYFNESALDNNHLNCIVSHCVEAIIDKVQDFRAKKLCLAGHSHGGQIRVPFFGAILTSTKYWKLFEYGHYVSKKHNTDLILTSGIGTSRMPIRLFCKPEVTVINLI